MFKQTETKVITTGSDQKQQSAVRAKNRTSDEFRTKSNIKSTAAFEQAEQIVVSSMKEQHVKQESRSKFDFHPDVVDADGDAKDEILDSEEEMQETQKVPSAQQRPSLPPMDSEKSVKNVK